MTHTQQTALSGMWHFCYWAPTHDDMNEETSEYDMRAHQKGRELIFESINTGKNDAYLVVRLTLDGQLAPGTWHETTATTGDFKGMMYSGAGQLIMSKDKKRLSGMWAGVGIDHSNEEPRVYTGKWEFTKLD